MATLTKTSDGEESRLNDYFTTTVVGLPQEVSLGHVFSNRLLKSDQYVAIDAIFANAWLSDPARKLLKQRVKQARHAVGLPFPTGSFSRHRRWSRSTLLAFLGGVGACLVLMAVLAVYVMQPWLRLPFNF